MRILIDIPEEIHEKIQSGEFWLSCGLNLSNAYDFIKNGTPIPDNATNGDVIKAIKAMFPFFDIKIYEHKGYAMVFYDDFYTTYPLRWWNAPYQKGGKE